jgi:hypothetical protein
MIVATCTGDAGYTSRQHQSCGDCAILTVASRTWLATMGAEAKAQYVGEVAVPGEMHPTKRAACLGILG